jgi:hypothetical protein
MDFVTAAGMQIARTLHDFLTQAFVRRGAKEETVSLRQQSPVSRNVRNPPASRPSARDSDRRQRLASTGAKRCKEFWISFHLSTLGFLVELKGGWRNGDDQ